MADYSITAASILAADDDTQISTGIFGETITAGQVVYRSTTDRRWYKADADTATTAPAVGIAINGGAAGQPGSIVTAGNLTTNSTGTAGAVVVVSTTAGGLAPVADLGSGDYVTVVGVFTSATNLLVSFIQSGVAKP